MPTVANVSPEISPAEPALLGRFVVAAGDPLAGAGALRDDEGRGQAGCAQAQVAARDVEVAPLLPAPAPAA